MYIYLYFKKLTNRCNVHTREKNYLSLVYATYISSSNMWVVFKCNSWGYTFLHSSCNTSSYTDIHSHVVWRVHPQGLANLDITIITLRNDEMVCIYYWYLYLFHGCYDLIYLSIIMEIFMLLLWLLMLCYMKTLKKVSDMLNLACKS